MWIEVPDGTCTHCRGMGSDPDFGSDVPCYGCGGSGSAASREAATFRRYYRDAVTGVVFSIDDPALMKPGVTYYETPEEV